MSMTLWVTDGNSSATELYAHAGFEFTGERGTMPSGPASGMQTDARLTRHRPTGGVLGTASGARREELRVGGGLRAA